MTVDEIKALFPVAAEITQEIIDKAVLCNTGKCIGALTLKSVLPEELQPDTTWGVTTGTVRDKRLNGVRITTTEKVDMMDVKKAPKCCVYSK